MASKSPLSLKSGTLKGNAFLMAVVIARKAWTGNPLQGLGPKTKRRFRLRLPSVDRVLELRAGTIL